MTTPRDPLREALHGLADEVTDTDLYGRALRRSRRIAQQRAAAGTLSALTVLGLACGGLWYLAPPSGPAESGSSTAAGEPAPVVVASTLPAATAQAAQPRPPTSHRAPPRREPQREPGATGPRSRSLADLPGHVFYNQREGEHRVVRLARGGTTHTVLSTPHDTLGVSPDGLRIAYVEDGSLLIAGTDGGPPERAYPGTVSAAQAPAWSPDGTKLLVATDEPVVLNVAGGTLSALPQDPAGAHFQWSGDGSKLVYATPSCRLKVATATIGSAPAETVPVLGDPDATENPGGLSACRPVSVDATGSRVTVVLYRADGDDGDTVVATAVVDTTTGRTDPLPVLGTIIGAVFDADGDLLVRAVQQGRTTLSLIAPDGALLVEAPEPSRLNSLDLVAYTD